MPEDRAPGEEMISNYDSEETGVKRGQVLSGNKEGIAPEIVALGSPGTALN